MASLRPNIYIFDTHDAHLPEHDLDRDQRLVPEPAWPATRIAASSWPSGRPAADGNLYEIDPSTGSVLSEGHDNNQGSIRARPRLRQRPADRLRHQWLRWPGNNFLDEYDPNTLALHASVCPSLRRLRLGLAGDGLGGISSDWYQFNVNAGDNLVLTTTTPGGSSANGLQFINDLDPTINLYDDAAAIWSQPRPAMPAMAATT